MRKPMTAGANTASMPGISISLMADDVQMAMQRPWLGNTSSPTFNGAWISSVRRPGYKRNWRVTSTMMDWAAEPTDSMVRAANTNGMQAPIMTPASTTGAVRSTMVTPASLVKAAIRPAEVSTAEPMAKPLPVAAVVLPRASRASVRSRAYSGNSSPDISAIPPALSATGPYASVARVMDRVDSMPTAARAMPYWPANSSHARMAMHTAKVGTTTDSMPTPRPLMITVAPPVGAAASISMVGW
mmetsp:Transcript_55967/g.113951  ORF Transcript_55967/g.113951 Transcript_55967/m.113951 type:complete len:243 (-) Transcript_55967:1359-2087(-)